MQHLVQMKIVAQGNPARVDLIPSLAPVVNRIPQPGHIQSLNPICRAYGSGLPEKMGRHTGFAGDKDVHFTKNHWGLT
jgi:hypothetical protein